MSPTMLSPESTRTRRPSTTRSGWLHLCNGLDPVRDGGMVPSILGLTGSLAEQGGRVRIVTPTPSRLDLCPVPVSVGIAGPETPLEDAVRDAEIVHMHGLWQSQTRRGARAARRAGVPYLIAAHGMAEPWALRHKALKKTVYTALVEGTNLRKAACLHALSRPEVGHLRALAPRTPVCLVPNGVDLSPFDGLPPRETLESELPELVGKRVALFYGRVHVKKGLDLLAEAFAAVRDDHPDLHLVIAGKDDGALSPFMGRIAASGLEKRVTYLGHVAGERSRAVWARADAFVLPSYSEGFSMAILEALACRLPVLVTTACHFPELDDVGGGITVRPDTTSVTAGLRDLLERSPEQCAELGAQGRALVESRYTWDRQAERLADVYHWILGGGPAPDAVVLNGEHTR